MISLENLVVAAISLVIYFAVTYLAVRTAIRDSLEKRHLHQKEKPAEELNQNS